MHFQVQGFGYVLEMKNGIIHVLDFLSFLNYK